MDPFSPLRVLIVDDDPDILHSIKRHCRKEGWETITCDNGQEAIELINKHTFSAIISDVCMPHVTGIEVLEHALHKSPDSGRILLSGLSTLNDAVEAINICQADKFLLKPCDCQTIIDQIKKYNDIFQLRIDNHKMSEKISQQNTDLKSLNKKLLEYINKNHKSMLTSWKIQSKLLIDDVPDNLHNSEICCYTIPAQELNGDFILFNKFSDHIYDLVVGDVMGKGITAALQGAAVKSAFQYEWGRCHNSTEISISEILTRVASNTVAEISNIDSFISMFYCRINTQLQSIEYLDCGSTKPILHNRNRTEEIDGINLPFGISGEIDSYQSITKLYENGSSLCLYSDGIIEAQDASTDTLYGVERLTQLLETTTDLSASQTGRLILDDVKRFSHKQTHLDDFTVVIIKFEQSKGDKTKNNFHKSEELELFTGIDRQQFIKKLEHFYPKYDNMIMETLWSVFCDMSVTRYNNQPDLPIWLCHRREVNEWSLMDYGLNVKLTEKNFLVATYDHDSIARNRIVLKI